MDPTGIELSTFWWGSKIRVSPYHLTKPASLTKGVPSAGSVTPRIKTGGEGADPVPPQGTEPAPPRDADLVPPEGPGPDQEGGPGHRNGTNRKRTVTTGEPRKGVGKGISSPLHFVGGGKMDIAATGTAAPSPIQKVNVEAGVPNEETREETTTLKTL